MSHPALRERLLHRLLLKGRLRQLQIVSKVARSGSMLQAARDLSISQPAITKAVSELESDLGIQLFERHARGIRLTSDGNSVMPQLERILDAADQLAEAVVARKEWGSSVLRIGSVAAGISGLLATRIPPFCKQNPDVVMKVEEVDGPRILSLIARDEFDVVICRTPEAVPEGWTFTPVIEDEHAIVAAPAHPLVGRADVTLSDLHACTWLMPPAGVPAVELVERLFQGWGTPRTVQLPTRSITLNRAAIRELGLVSAAPISIFRAELEYATLARIDFPLASALAPLGILRPNHSAGLATERFTAFLTS